MNRIQKLIDDVLKQVDDLEPKEQKFFTDFAGRLAGPTAKLERVVLDKAGEELVDYLRDGGKLH